MRNSNSRDKPSVTTYTQNRLMKTQLPPKSNTKQALNSTQYKLPPPSTPSIKRIQSSKTTTSSKQLPKQEINYDIQNNMTQSKIINAKQSLQLLKKKMNRTGMSRQKIPAGQTTQNIPSMQKTNYPPQSMKKIKSDSSKNLQNYQPSYNKYQQEQSYKPKDTYQPVNYKANSKKVIPQQQQKPDKSPLIKKPQPYIKQQFRNEVQQIPIVRKQTFEQMLERQLKKQQAAKKMGGNNSNNYSKNNKFQQPPQYAQQGELYQCSKGCGRQFNANVLAKHQKVCQKVFQQKRKVFNTAAQRQVQNEGGFQKPPEPVNYMNQTKKPVQNKNKVPKWKLQSAQLRAGLKAIGNKPLTKQQQALTNMHKDSLVPCNYCGRKFNQEAAKRHIPVCQKKAKQMPRPSNPTKKR